MTAVSTATVSAGNAAAAEPLVTIIVVSFNTRDLTLACLESVYAETRDVAYDVVVVDNASDDGSADAIAARFPRATLIRLDRNIGFAAANNLAAERASSAFLLLLNPDTLVRDGALQALVRFAQRRPDAGIVGGRTIFADGRLNPTSCWARPTPWSAFCRGAGLSALFRGSRWFDPESMADWPRDSVREVDIVTGCLFLVRRDVWRRLGGFDPGFFMYGEEADFCLRAARLGVPRLFCPDACIVHYGGASEATRAGKIVRLFEAKSLLFQRHWSPGAARFGIWTMDFWAGSRCVAFGVLRWIRPRWRESHAAWREIWRNRRRWRGSADARSGIANTGLSHAGAAPIGTAQATESREAGSNQGR